jgi:hypothetical protein
MSADMAIMITVFIHLIEPVYEGCALVSSGCFRNNYHLDCVLEAISKVINIFNLSSILPKCGDIDSKEEACYHFDINLIP